MVSAPTFGLPSMSPPTQVPKPSSGGSSNVRPYVDSSASAKVSWKTGSTRYSTSAR